MRVIVDMYLKYLNWMLKIICKNVYLKKKKAKKNILANSMCFVYYVYNKHLLKCYNQVIYR